MANKLIIVLLALVLVSSIVDACDDKGNSATMANSAKSEALKKMLKICEKIPTTATDSKDKQDCIETAFDLYFK